MAYEPRAATPFLFTTHTHHLSLPPPLTAQSLINHNYNKQQCARLSSISLSSPR